MLTIVITLIAVAVHNSDSNAVTDHDGGDRARHGGDDLVDEFDDELATSTTSSTSTTTSTSSPTTTTSRTSTSGP